MQRDPSAGHALPRRITGYHRDEDQHWVADLECGHAQHVRHDPPWQSRPWVITESGRALFLGTLLACVQCVQEGRTLHIPEA